VETSKLSRCAPLTLLAAEMNEGVALGDDVSPGQGWRMFYQLGHEPVAHPVRMRVSRSAPSLLGRRRRSWSKRKVPWWKCQTCEQAFTGEMKDGLANAWWSRVRDRAEDDGERLSAAVSLDLSLSRQGKYIEAEKMESGC
jgi:hypothetical protein